MLKNKKIKRVMKHFINIEIDIKGTILLAIFLFFTLNKTLNYTIGIVLIGIVLVFGIDWDNFWWKKRCIAKNLSKSGQKMPKNIYGGKTFKEHIKKFNFFHYAFKEFTLVPLVLLFKRWFGKYMIGKVPKGYHNKSIKIFDEEFEKSIKEWTFRFLCGDSTKKQKKQTKIKSWFTGQSQVVLRTLKELVLTGILHDTAYREFFVILLHNLANGMQKEYSGKEVCHIMYTNKSVYDVRYFVAWTMNELKQIKTPEEAQVIIDKAKKDGLPIGLQVTQMCKFCGNPIKPVVDPKMPPMNMTFCSCKTRGRMVADQNRGIVWSKERVDSEIKKLKKPKKGGKDVVK